MHSTAVFFRAIRKKNSFMDEVKRWMVLAGQWYGRGPDWDQTGRSVRTDTVGTRYNDEEYNSIQQHREVIRR